MKLHELAGALDLRELTPCADGDEELTQGFASDLFSDVLAHAPAGGVLVTILTSPDVVAVAGLAGLRAVIFAEGRTPDRDLVARATAEGISLFESQADSFEVVGQLYESGLRGSRGPDGATPTRTRAPRGGHRAEPGWAEPLSFPLLLVGGHDR